MDDWFDMNHQPSTINIVICYLGRDRIAQSYKICFSLVYRISISIAVYRKIAIHMKASVPFRYTFFLRIGLWY
jgi:hypothetical protein